MNNLTETNKRLNEVLEVETETQESEGELLPAVVEEEENNFPLPTNPIDERTEDHDIDFDYEYSRSTQRDLIAMGTEAVEGALAVAKESQHPRAYEVAGNMLKNISDIADKLMILHEKRKSINKENPPPAPTQINVDKGVFVGSTSELLKQIRQDKK